MISGAMDIFAPENCGLDGLAKEVGRANRSPAIAFEIATHRPPRAQPRHPPSLRPPQPVRGGDGIWTAEVRNLRSFRRTSTPRPTVSSTSMMNWGQRSANAADLADAPFNAKWGRGRLGPTTGTPAGFNNATRNAF